MCGLLGGVGQVARSLSPDVLVRAISHRGPDGNGYFRNDDLLLVHTRLAIIDVAAGAQPMFSADGRFALVFNGEIYNYKILRDELAGGGSIFHTNSDTEVLLEAFERWGVDALRRLRGMFAFALADLREKQLWLVRDHFGIKPLFYRTLPGGILFGSELGAVLDMDSSELEVVPERLDFFLRYRHIPAPLTVYRDAYKLEPGCALVVGFDGSIVQRHNYYVASVEHSALDPTLRAGELEDCLRGSVRAHLIADVPRGVLLSGGVDSSIITLLAKEEDQDLVSGYTITSDERSSIGDAASARELARSIGLNHHERGFGDEDFDILPDLLRHFGEPFGDSSILPTYYVSALARKEVKVALSGEGADEVFGGYPQYIKWLGGDSGRLPMRGALSGLTGGRILAGIRRLLSQSHPHTEKGWEAAMAVCSTAQREGLWRREWKSVVSRSCGPVESAARRSSHLDALTFAQNMHLHMNLANDMLAKVDVAAMHCALEVRTPFLDTEVLAAARRIEPEDRLKMDWTGGARAKAPLKDLLASMVGADFADRPKRGFEIPRQDVFVPGKRSYEMLQEFFLSNRDLDRFFDKSVCKDWLRSPIENSDRLFLLLSLGIWWGQWGRRCSVLAPQD